MRSLALSPDGQLLAVGEPYSTVRLWRVTDGKFLRQLEVRDVRWARSAIESVAFSPNGYILATAVGKSVGLWQVPSGSPIRVLRGHTGWVKWVAFSPGGSLLASGGDDHEVYLWRVRDGTLLQVLYGHTSSVWSVAFSPDDALLASGGGDGIVRLWRLADYI